MTKLVALILVALAIGMMPITALALMRDAPARVLVLFVNPAPPPAPTYEWDI